MAYQLPRHPEAFSLVSIRHETAARFAGVVGKGLQTEGD